MAKWDVDKGTSQVWIAVEAARSLVGSMKKRLGVCFTQNFCYFKNHDFLWCTLEEENIKVGNFLVEKFRDKDFSVKFAKNYHNFYKVCAAELNKLDKADFLKLSDKKLFDILVRANNLYIENFDWGFFAEPMDFVMPEIVGKRLKALGYSDSEVSDMLVIGFNSFLNREEQNLLGILKKPKSKQMSLLKSHAYKYRWLQSDHMGRRDIPFSYFLGRFNNFRKKNVAKELRKFKDFRSKILENKKRIVSGKPLDKDSKKLLRVAEVITPLHDLRKELFLRVVYTIDTVRCEIGRRHGFSKDEISVLEIKDILKLIKGKRLDREKIKELSKEALFFVDTKKDTWHYYSGKKAGLIVSRELHEDVSEVVEIKGMIASPGKAVGFVRIIHGTKDVNKMEQGNILVASMTKPEIIPAIRKAAAIVTDEGGVTCHAAIVSREFKIPCIIGTRIASNALKDGDKVEVDADKGIVRKIK